MSTRKSLGTKNFSHPCKSNVSAEDILVTRHYTTLRFCFATIKQNGVQESGISARDNGIMYTSPYNSAIIIPMPEGERLLVGKRVVVPDLRDALEAIAQDFPAIEKIDKKTGRITWNHRK